MSLSTLFTCFTKIKDPRKKRGIRHNFQSILKLVTLGFCCRLVCLEHIVLFAKEHWKILKKELDFTRNKPPDATTIGRVLAKIDLKELEKAFREWISSILDTEEEYTASVDGKVLKNVQGDKGNPICIVNVFIHDIKLAIAQIKVEEKKGESTALKEALKKLFKKYPGLRILTGDAAFSGRDLCSMITEIGRDYFMQIKGNQPKIHEVLKLHFEEETQNRKADDFTEEKKRFDNQKRNLDL